MATGRVPTTANSPLTAKGDLFTYSTASARLAVGNNGESLVADSSASTGLRYQSAYNGNGSINGGMDNFQRGTSFTGTTTNTYCADRWIAYRNAAGSTFSRQSSGLTGFLYATRVQRDNANTSVSDILLAQMFESQETYKYAGQTVTLSWYAKAGANFSAASSQMIARIYTGTGTDQNWIQTGYTGQATTLNNLTTITTSYVRYSATVAIPSATTELSITFGFTPVGTAGANDWVEITGVQLELGSVATTFKRAGGTLQGETSACQRYYVRLGANNGGTTGAYSTYGNGYSTQTTDASINITLPTTMRIPPTVCEFSNVAIQDFNTAVIAVSNVTINSAFVSTTVAVVAATTVGATQFRGCKLSNNNNTAGYVGFSAEL